MIEKTKTKDKMGKVKDHQSSGMKSDSQKSPLDELKEISDLRGFAKGIDTNIERDEDRI